MFPPTTSLFSSHSREKESKRSERLNWKSVEHTPEHGSEVYYTVVEHDGVSVEFGIFELAWCDDDFDIIEYNGDDSQPGQEYGVIGLINDALIESDSHWVTSKEMLEGL